MLDTALVSGQDLSGPSSFDALWLLPEVKLDTEAVRRVTVYSHGPLHLDALKTKNAAFLFILQKLSKMLEI